MYTVMGRDKLFEILNVSKIPRSPKRNLLTLKLRFEKIKYFGLNSVLKGEIIHVLVPSRS